jgi:hypothetical protein
VQAAELGEVRGEVLAPAGGEPGVPSQVGQAPEPVPLRLEGPVITPRELPGRGQQHGGQGCVHGGANRASMASAASDCMEGRTWEYRSKVIPTLACPRRSETTLGWTR